MGRISTPLKFGSGDLGGRNFLLKVQILKVLAKIAKKKKEERVLV